MQNQRHMKTLSEDLQTKHQEKRKTKGAQLAIINNKTA